MGSNQSPVLSPHTSCIKFALITNVGGDNGNDLSMDDFKIDRCINFILRSGTTVCNPKTLLSDAGREYIF